MIYTPLTRKAMNIAYDAHHGQYDKTGVPYIFHPFHVAEMMDDEISVCCALLHDVIEDTDITLEELRNLFPDEVIIILDLLTHRENESYKDYLARIKGHPQAEKIKRADIAHNSDLTRGDFSDEVKEYFKNKYKNALEFLNE